MSFADKIGGTKGVAGLITLGAGLLGAVAGGLYTGLAKRVNQAVSIGIFVGSGTLAGAGILTTALAARRPIYEIPHTNCRVQHIGRDRSVGFMQFRVWTGQNNSVICTGLPGAKVENGVVSDWSALQEVNPQDLEKVKCFVSKQWTTRGGATGETTTPEPSPWENPSDGWN